MDVFEDFCRELELMDTLDSARVIITYYYRLLAPTMYTKMYEHIQKNITRFSRQIDAMQTTLAQLIEKSHVYADEGDLESKILRAEIYIARLTYENSIYTWMREYLQVVSCAEETFPKDIAALIAGYLPA